MTNDKKKKIIVMDDDRHICDVLSTILTKNGYEVKSYNDGNNVIDILKREKPDLILLDIVFAVPPDGISICKQIKKNRDVKDIPIIMLTGQENIDDIDKSFSCGADDYIFKPFESKILLKKIRGIYVVIVPLYKFYTFVIADFIRL